MVGTLRRGGLHDWGWRRADSGGSRWARAGKRSVAFHTLRRHRGGTARLPRADQGNSARERAASPFAPLRPRLILVWRGGISVCVCVCVCVCARARDHGAERGEAWADGAALPVRHGVVRVLSDLAIAHLRQVSSPWRVHLGRCTSSSARNGLLVTVDIISARSCGPRSFPCVICTEYTMYILHATHNIPPPWRRAGGGTRECELI